ncbi:MAG: DNA primase [Candidatus Binatia bacterium]|nr:MAG: DNA primase [Candidatus Binatia bacterium]
MAGRLPDDLIQEVQERVSIVEVVSQYVSLKRSGQNFVGLCPFHEEKTPSFTVREEKGLFHCFGCGAGGSVFQFLMRAEGVTFPESVRLLAARAGVRLPEAGGPGGSAREREALLRANAWALGKFRGALEGAEGKEAREYLEARGVARETVSRFRLGYAPAGGEFLVRELAGRERSLEVACRAGLVGRREGGGYYDRFRRRLMFPIEDARGAVCGFGGRVLGEGMPKYLNSPETAVFRKAQLLYGLLQAREAIRKEGRALVVEGYMDVLAVSQSGMENVVATLGTALGPSHLRRLSRLATDIVLLFDGDEAGREAAERAFSVCAEAGVWVRVGFLPGGEDPDSLVRARGPESLRAVVDSARDVADLFFERLRLEAGASFGARARAAERVASLVAAVRNPLGRELLLRRAAECLGVSEEALVRGPRKADAQGPPAASDPVPGPPAEWKLLEAMAAEREVAREVVEQGALDSFSSPVLRDWGRKIATAWEDGERAVASVLDTLPPAVAGRLSGSVLRSEGVGSSELRRVAADCVRKVLADAERRAAEEVLRELRAAQEAGDERREKELLERYQARLEKRRAERQGVSLRRSGC